MKKNVVSLHKNNYSLNETGTVKGKSGSFFVLETQEGLINARKAFSCIVEPEPGDKVLVNISERECYILSILERPFEHGQNLSLEFPADAKFKAPNGQIDIISSKDLNILSAGKTDLFSSKLNISSMDAEMKAKRFKSSMDEVDVTAKKITLFSETLISMAKRVTQTAQNIMRKVEGVETVSAGNLIQNIKKVFSQNSGHTVFTAKKDMKIDAKRIHMG